MKNILIGQSGGPTAVINSSLAGVIKAAVLSEKIGKIYGMINGIDGFFEENIIDLEIFADEHRLRLLGQTPSSYLGSCRRKLPDVGENEEFYIRLFGLFEKYNIGYFVYIGGNDSMDTVKKLTAYAKTVNSDIVFAGVPKTIDNDLALTDHTPGFGSAAKFVANSIRQIAMDTSVYNMKSIVVAEIMGRNAGWLTAAASLANSEKLSPVDIILLPETVFDRDAFIERIAEVMRHKNSTVIAVSEGIKDKFGHYISEGNSPLFDDGFSHATLGGVGKILADEISGKLKIKTRSIEFSTLQRCFSQSISLCDCEESFLIGFSATQYAMLGNSGFMAGFRRVSDEPYKIETEFFDVNAVANIEKKVPENMIGKDKMSVTDDFVRYAKPLIQGEPDLIFKDGVIDFEVR